MRRTVTAVLVGLLALASPALAQPLLLPSGGGAGAPDALNAQGTAVNPDVQSDGVAGSADATGAVDGTQAFAQAPPSNSVSPFLIIGGIAGGAGLIAYAISQNQSGEPTSP